MLQTMHSVLAHMKTSQVYFVEELFRISSHAMLGLCFVGFMEQVQVTAMTTDWSEVYLSECVCVWGVDDRQTPRSQIPMSNQKELNPDEEGRHVHRLDESSYFHFKVQSKHSGSVLIGQCRQNNKDPIFAVIIRIANGDVVQLLTKNEKGFEEGIRGFFFSQIANRRLFLKLPSDVFLSTDSYGTGNES